MLFSNLLVLFLACCVPLATAFTPPVYGIGGLIFPVRNVELITAAETDNVRATLAECSDFFVDAFWESKLGGQLSKTQRSSLYQQQLAEFTKRYGNIRRNSELVIIEKQSEILGIVGIEVDSIRLDPEDPSDTISAPLMSNLAISKAFRRRGLAERLVAGAERVVRDGSLNCDNESLYLYVEQRNRPAVKLYQKLGYRIQWKNPNAESASPTKSGSLQTTTTTVLCMKKQLIGGNRFFVFGS